MGTLIIQWSLYPYLVSICIIELDVLNIPKSQIYHAINGIYLLTFKIYLFLIFCKWILTNVRKGTKGSLSYFHPFQCYFIAFICINRIKMETFTFLYTLPCLCPMNIPSTMIKKWWNLIFKLINPTIL
jgi:hypothetical protein